MSFDNTVTVQKILQNYLPLFEDKYSLSSHQRKVANDMIKCRTEECGMHIDTCEHCAHQEMHYNSCRNRHCNLCQTVKREIWIHREKFNTLDHIKYFHVVFTIPQELHSLFLLNPKICLTLLFKNSAATLNQAALDKTHLGAQIGFTSVLHTWGQNLSYHPHIHLIASGGGLKDNTWLKSKDIFFLPVKVLSMLFRGKLLDTLKKEKNLKLPKDMDKQKFYAMISSLYDKEWVVYTKKPFKDCSHVIKYLGRYTHKVAISNGRIKTCEDGKVSFTYKDYRDKNKIKEMTLDALEFIRRYMLHILPSGFMKIRHYGFLSNGNKKKRLTLCKKLTKTPILPFVEINALQVISTLLKRDISLCSKCGMKKHPLLE